MDGANRPERLKEMNSEKVKQSETCLKVKSGIRAGEAPHNHNQTRAKPSSTRLKVKSGVKAGAICPLCH